jgi:hypothetical protein
MRACQRTTRRQTPGMPRSAGGWSSLAKPPGRPCVAHRSGSRSARQLGSSSFRADLLRLRSRQCGRPAAGGLLDAFDGLDAPAEIAPALAQLRIQLGGRGLAPQLHLAQRRFMDRAQAGWPAPAPAVGKLGLRQRSALPTPRYWVWLRSTRSRSLQVAGQVGLFGRLQRKAVFGVELAEGAASMDWISAHSALGGATPRAAARRSRCRPS